MSKQRIGLVAVVVVGLLLAGYVIWNSVFVTELPEGIAVGNGRIEAERVDIAAKVAGRVEQVLVDEGAMVAANEVVAVLDDEQVQASLREAKASVRQAEQQMRQGEALLAQRASELEFAKAELERTLKLRQNEFATEERADLRRKEVATATAAIRSAEAQIDQSKAAIEAAKARVARIETEVEDRQLRAPRDGRVQYRLVEPGEVIGPGGKVLTLLDLTDVTMSIFLPTREAGRLSMGSEARLVLDAAPEFVIPATVSFVAADAQFTPKFVETREVRTNLMFRVRLRVPKEVLEKYADLVKTGLPGVGYVKTRRDQEWPERLRVRLPE